MARSEEQERRYQHAKETYLAGTQDLKALASMLSIPIRTLQGWKKDDDWDDEINEVAELEKEIELNSLKALKVGLEKFSNNPEDTSLQSLVALLKGYQNRKKPSKELHEYILKFFDQSVDYFHSKNLVEFCSEYQSHIADLAEYLRVVNDG